MRTFIFLFITSAFSFTPKSILSQNISIIVDESKEVSVMEILDLIDEQTKYSFVYSQNQFKGLKKVHLDKGTISANGLLQSVLSQGDFNVIVNDNETIFIKRKEVKSIAVDRTISGIVKGPEGEPLPGVNILVKNTAVGTSTDFDGNFTLDIPEDAKTLIVSYLGYKTKEVAIGTKKDFTIVLQEDASQLEEIVIVGQRRSNLNAITTKRQNVMMIDAISSDEVGSLPDDNVGDALRRIPGVSQKGDQGETRFVSVRGLNPDYNFFSLNGSRIAVPDRNGRRVFLDVLPSSLSKELQAVKTFTADLDAGGVGAHINLVPRSAFDYKGKTYFKAYARGGVYENNKGTETVGPSVKGDLIFAWKPKKSDKFGFLLAADYYKRRSFTDHLENSGRINFYNKNDNSSLSPVFTEEGRRLKAEDGTILGFDDENVFLAPDGVNRYLYFNNRTRVGVSAVLDYKVLPDASFKFIQFYNEGADDEARYGNRFIGDANVNYGTRTSGFVDFEHRLETAGFDFKRQVWGSQLVFNQNLGESKLEVKGNYSGASFANDENFYRFTTTDTGSGEALRLNYHYELDDRNALLTPLDLDAYNNLDSYVLRGFSNFQELRDLREDIFETQVDFSNKINEHGFGYKVGAKHRIIDRDYNEDQLRWIPTNANNFVAGDYLANNYTPSRLTGVSSQNLMYIIDENKAIEGLKETRDNTALFSLQDRVDRSNERDYGVTENVTAGYAMFSHKGEKHFVNAGLRVEKTSFEGRGRKTEEVDGEDVWADVVNSGSYMNWLPSVSTYYNVTDKFKVRASYSQSLGRPDFISFAPRGESLSIAEADGQNEIRGQRGNPDLKPRVSNNFDLSLEYYLDSSKGLISVGGFHKNIKNEFFKLTESTIARVDGQTLPAYISQYSNLENDVKITGVEFNIIKDLDFLPGFLGNLGVSLNSLFIFNPKVLVPNTDITGANDENQDVDLDGKNDLFPYTELDGLLEQSNEVYNASLYYQKGKVDARIAYHYTGSFLDNIDTSNPERNRRQLGRDILDFKFKFKLNKQVSFYLLTQNITNSGRRIDYEIPNTANIAQLVKRDYGRAFFVGTSIRLRK